MRTLPLSFVLVAALAAAAIAQTDIRDVDFKNFTYSAYCIGAKPQKITVKDGAFYEEKQEEGYVDRFSFDIREIKYGDLNGDRRDEAIILSSCNTGGTGNFSEGYVYSIRAGKPALIGRIAGGDRAYGGLRSTRVDRGFLFVESNDVGEEGGACCPQYIITTQYKLVAGKLQKIGKPLRESIDRTERVYFEKGKSEATLTIYVSGSSSKKFVVGARSGQTLSISVDNENASIHLITAANTSGDDRSVKAVLPKNGDYVFEIRNASATEDEIKLNVRIQ